MHNTQRPLYKRFEALGMHERHSHTPQIFHQDPQRVTPSQRRRFGQSFAHAGAAPAGRQPKG
jgi:hypothetical protein